MLILISLVALMMELLITLLTVCSFVKICVSGLSSFSKYDFANNSSNSIFVSLTCSKILSVILVKEIDGGNK